MLFDIKKVAFSKCGNVFQCAFVCVSVCSFDICYGIFFFKKNYDYDFDFELAISNLHLRLLE